MNRTRNLTIRLTEQEYDNIKRNANKHSNTITDWIVTQCANSTQIKRSATVLSMRELSNSTDKDVCADVTRRENDTNAHTNTDTDTYTDTNTDTNERSSIVDRIMDKLNCTKTEAINKFMNGYRP